MGKPVVEEVELLDWKPYEIEDAEGFCHYGAYCYVSQDDGVVRLADIELQARHLLLDFAKARLYVKDGWLIVDVPVL